MNGWPVTQIDCGNVMTPLKGSKKYLLQPKFVLQSSLFTDEGNKLYINFYTRQLHTLEFPQQVRAGAMR